MQANDQSSIINANLGRHLRAQANSLNSSLERLNENFRTKQLDSGAGIVSSGTKPSQASFVSPAKQKVRYGTSYLNGSQLRLKRASNIEAGFNNKDKKDRLPNTLFRVQNCANGQDHQISDNSIQLTDQKQELAQRFNKKPRLIEQDYNNDIKVYEY